MPKSSKYKKIALALKEHESRFSEWVTYGNGSTDAHSAGDGHWLEHEEDPQEQAISVEGAWISKEDSSFQKAQHMGVASSVRSHKSCYSSVRTTEQALQTKQYTCASWFMTAGCGGAHL